MKILPRFAARRSVAALSTEIWVAEPKHIEAFFADVRDGFETKPLGALFGEYEYEKPKPYRMTGGTAVIPVQGMILRQGDWFLDYFCTPYASTLRIQSALLEAENDPGVEAIALDVDSPGGTISGLESLAITLASCSKPTTANVGGQCCSAAYWIASQCKSIVAEPGAAVGSIGVYCTVIDASRMADNEGIKVHVIRSGEHKGVGEFGAAISETQLAKLQAHVDEAARRFRAAVESGRKLSAEQVTALATGEVWFAEDAVSLGLIDRVQPITSDASAGAASVEEPPAPGVPEEPQQQEQEAMELKEVLARVESLEARDKEKDAEIERLRKENADAKQAQAKAEAKAEANEAEAKAKAIADGEAQGRITPVNKAQIEKLAAHMTSTELAGHIGDLAVKTHANPIGTNPNNTSTVIANSVSDEQKLMNLFGVTPAAVAEFGNAGSISLATLQRKGN